MWRRQHNTWRNEMLVYILRINGGGVVSVTVHKTAKSAVQYVNEMEALCSGDFKLSFELEEAYLVEEAALVV
jgi:hypothetical protein